MIPLSCQLVSVNVELSLHTTMSTYRMFLTIYFLSRCTKVRWVGVWCYYLRFSYYPSLCVFPDFFLDYNIPRLIIFSFSVSLWLTTVVLRSFSLSPPRPDTTLSSRAGGLVRNFPDKLRYRRRAALGEDRLVDLRAGAGWWAWSPLIGCVILAESALEERQEGYFRWEKGFSTWTLWSLNTSQIKEIRSMDKCNKNKQTEEGSAHFSSEKASQLLSSSL